MTQVDRITEEIAHMPVAAFIFRDKESDEVPYSSDIRSGNKLIAIKIRTFRDRMSPALVIKYFSKHIFKKLLQRFFFLRSRMVEKRVGFLSWFVQEMQTVFPTRCCCC